MINESMDYVVFFQIQSQHISCLEAATRNFRCAVIHQGLDSNCNSTTITLP